jgi:excisionase family DNA binding protein
VERTLTLREAAEATGLTTKALQRRIDRGTLRAVLTGGRRRVPLSELYRAGLIEPEEPRPAPAAPAAAGAPGGGVGQVPAPAPEQPPVGEVIGELIARLERQAEQIGELRALERQAESLRAAAEAERRARDELESALFAARAEVTQLRAGVPGERSLGAWAIEGAGMLRRRLASRRRRRLGGPTRH